MSSLLVKDLVELAQRDYESNQRPYAAVFPSQMKPVVKALGTLKAERLGFQRIEDYKRERVLGGAARETVNKELSGLSKGFRLAHEGGLPVSVPIIRRLSPGAPRTGFLTVDEFERVAVELVRSIRGRGPLEAVRDVCEFAYWSGWRRGECFGLEWTETNEDWVWTRDKNGQAKHAPISGPLWPVLERRRAARIDGCPFVFHRHGRPIRDVRKAWGNACRRAGVEGRVFHDMRRSFVRNAIRAGIDRDTAMALSGHRTHAVFSRYNIQDERDLLDAATRLGQVAGGG